MVDISFYEVVVQPFEKTVSNLLKKCYDTEHNTFVKCKDEDQMMLMDKTIWTFSQKFFIPHATIQDPELHRQPVLLSTNEDIKNKAKILMLLSTDFSDIDSFERVVVVFDENNNKDREFCRDLYKQYKSNNHNLTYYKQDKKGIWQQA